MKAALALSKIKNEDLKTSETLIEEQRNDLMELKRQLLNEVSWMLINIEIIPSNDQKKNPQRKEKCKLLEKLRMFKQNALEAQSIINDDYKICGSGFKMKC